MPFLGEIRAFTGKELPDGWLPCDGRMLQINRNLPLFSAIGYRFGRDSQSFAIPDLRAGTLAGTQPDASLAIGAESGDAGGRLEELPYLVIRWAIAIQGEFPLADE